MKRLASVQFTGSGYRIDGRQRQELGPDEAILDPHTYEIVVGDERIPIAGNVRSYRLIDEPTHDCPECEAKGIDFGCATASALGSHRSKVHGVKGEKRKERAA